MVRSVIVSLYLTPSDHFKYVCHDDRITSKNDAEVVKFGNVNNWTSGFMS